MPIHQMGQHSGNSFEADIADLRARMVVVESGVSNFRKFQEGANKFFITFETTETLKAQTDKKRAQIHFWLLSGLIAVVGALATAVFEAIAKGHHL